jgi:hypothetical protein
MSIVVESRRTEEEIIIHKHDDGTSKQYLAVRGGLSWPLAIDKVRPAYYCIFGEELISVAQRRENQRGKLIFLHEYENPDILSLSEFFKDLTDYVKLLECNIFYTVTEIFQGKDYRGYTEAFQKFVYDKQSQAHLEEAPWADEPILGMNYIKEWMKKGLLELPEGTLVRDELKKVMEEKVNQLPQTLNAVNALRFVVCGFQKDKPNLATKDWRAKLPRGSWRSA